ncbi:hypothetical protein NDU88_005993 [Pleurodeles waltl]|uniref:Uncharacterized protein n=1 Tax=Pleurodeles waltl TaxID=8319 RepID=A0AAV7TCN5_PLEWA|nr:hypothetical protein NDU88_005993 [Pleurodeles waltl]
MLNLITYHKNGGALCSFHLQRTHADIGFRLSGTTRVLGRRRWQASVPEVGAGVVGPLKSHALQIKLHEGKVRSPGIGGVGLRCEAWRCEVRCPHVTEQAAA